MANKYTKTLSPPKENLEKLYFGKYMTQFEIGRIYNVSQRVVFRWFRDNNIKSRKAFKRYQRGPMNDSWKGHNVTYEAFHKRVISLYGQPQECSICGITDKSKSYDWANLTGKYHDISDYKRMCRSCHRKYDKKRREVADAREI